MLTAVVPVLVKANHYRALVCAVGDGTLLLPAHLLVVCVQSFFFAGCHVFVLWWLHDASLNEFLAEESVLLPITLDFLMDDAASVRLDVFKLLVQADNFFLVDLAPYRLLIAPLTGVLSRI